MKSYEIYGQEIKDGTILYPREGMVYLDEDLMNHMDKSIKFEYFEDAEEMYFFAIESNGEGIPDSGGAWEQLNDDVIIKYYDFPA